MPDDRAPGWHRGKGRARRVIDWRLAMWVAIAVVWAVVTYRAATWEIPEAVVAATAVTAAGAFAAGYLMGERA
ncbi:hypothetical protein [Blastococcus sp. CCUG 61487]|uniref:hypothetical protein n=1 Tax=Blastococcus sp. CCUG 61487 TaxID=1840703 RepID=UPI0010C096A2|nr:hypothetical protein [Blastococcus sp. CCUG 61487]TKJ24351.1 hypothetical protein A6V29_04965 [Blastococcus sp. CCUG 61487]